MQVPYEGAKASMVGKGWPEWQVDGILELNRFIDDHKYTFSTVEFESITGKVRACDNDVTLHHVTSNTGAPDGPAVGGGSRCGVQVAYWIIFYCFLSQNTHSERNSGCEPLDACMPQPLTRATESECRPR